MMRYYLICIGAVIGVTFVISWIRQTRSRKEFLTIMATVAGSFFFGYILIFLLSELLVKLGIAESGIF